MRWWLLSAAVGCGGPSEGAHAGLRAPALPAAARSLGGAALPDIGGGRPTLVSFWASWCGPCRRDAQRLVDVAGDGVDVLAINVGESGATAAAAATAWGLPGPVMVDPGALAQRAYGVESVPLVVLIDADGVVRYRGPAAPDDLSSLQPSVP